MSLSIDAPRKVGGYKLPPRPFSEDHWMRFDGGNAKIAQQRDLPNVMRLDKCKAE